MPDDDKDALNRARQDAEQGKAPFTQAGEFVKEEIHHVREGVHGARSPKQTIAIGLSKARRAGVKLPAPAKGKASEKVRTRAKHDIAKSRSHRKPSAKRSRATKRALRRESHNTASRGFLSEQTRTSAARRSSTARHKSARSSVRTKGTAGLRRAARKTAQTKQRRNR